MSNTLKTSNTLNQKFKRKWITALRSGDYEQGESVLKVPKNQQYCCLGVACVVAGVRSCDISDKGLPSQLSAKLQAKLPPFFRSNEEDGDHEGLVALADMNDSGKTFAEIADYIEDNF